MTFDEIRNLMATDPRFKEYSDPQMIEKTIDAFKLIMDSDKLKVSSERFLKKQVDLDRYVKIAKQVAGIAPKHTKSKNSLPDENLIGNPRDIDDTTAKDIYVDDLRRFYYDLDTITDNRHNFTDKVTKLLPIIEYKSNIRPHVRTIYDEFDNYVGSEVGIDTTAEVGNRTAINHEAWHYFSEENLGGAGNGISDQFIGEIGTMFIDKLSLDYMLKVHNDDKTLIESLKEINDPTARMNIQIRKAREAYFDYVVCKIISGKTQQDRENAITELMNGLGKYWTVKDISYNFNRLIDIAKDQKKHFDPMYEFRYVIGYAVSGALYDKDIPLSDKVNLMTDINDNIVNIDRLGDKSQNPIDIVTNYLGLDSIETLIDEQYYGRKRTKTPRVMARTEKEYVMTK